MLKSVLRTPTQEAREQDLVARLASVDRDSSRSNCFGFAFYVAGLLAHERMISDSQTVSAHLARTVLVAVPKRGDIAAFWHRDYGYVHGAIVLQTEPFTLEHRFSIKHPVTRTTLAQAQAEYGTVVTYHRVYGMTVTPRLRESK